jgi:hypothetical protein
VVGGATVGLGLGLLVGWPVGAEVVGPVAGWVLWLVVPAFGAAELVWPPEGDVEDWPGFLPAEAEGFGDEPLADGEAPALWPAGVPEVPVVLAVLDVDPVTLLAVLENSVVMPKAVTTLSKVVRHVIRESLRSPESLLAPGPLCLMPELNQGLG